MATVLVGLLVFVLAALAVRSIWKDRRSGKCSGGCAGCSGACRGCGGQHR